MSKGDDQVWYAQSLGNPGPVEAAPLVSSHVDGPPTDWTYTKPKKGGKMQLLTIGGISVTGDWRGEVGEYFLAWAPLLRRNKKLEREILAYARRKE